MIDLTKRKGSLNPVSDYKKQLNKTPFLTEVWVSNALKCCYFGENDSDNNLNGDYYFEMGYIKIPRHFQFVTNTETYELSEKMTHAIATNLIYNISETPPSPKEDHICLNTNWGQGGGLASRTPQGCSELLRVAPSNNNLTEVRDAAIETPIFYFKGELLFSDDYSEDCGYFLFPMALTEGLVVYFVVKEDASTQQKHRQILDEIGKMLKEDPTLGNSIGIYERLQLNDKLGIFVTRIIGVGHDKLAHFPFEYDVVTLDRK